MDNSQLHQKTALIPFIEKRGVFNAPEKLSSEYLNIDKKIKNNNTFKLHGLSYSIYICYEALFPEKYVHNGVVITQSDYIRLNNGRGYKTTLVNGSLLAKFSVAPNTRLINVQNMVELLFLIMIGKLTGIFITNPKKNIFLWLLYNTARECC
ncbi:hypothetical protein ACVTNA_27965 [Escherichia coli]